MTATDEQLRATALDEAIRSSDIYDTADGILMRAEKYLAFLKGEDPNKEQPKGEVPKDV